MMLTLLPLAAANKYDNPDTIVVSRDGTGEFRTIDEAIEVCRAFMEYTKVIYVKKGVYKEKLIIPSWLTNIIICGEDRDQTIITWDDHANIKMPVGGLDSEAAVKGKPMGTFRTYTLKVQGSYITLKTSPSRTTQPNLDKQFPYILKAIISWCRTVDCWAIRIQSIQALPTTALPFTTVILREPPISSLVREEHGLRIVRFIARLTATLQQHPVLPVRNMVMCSISASSPPSQA